MGELGYPMQDFWWNLYHSSINRHSMHASINFKFFRLHLVELQNKSSHWLTTSELAWDGKKLVGNFAAEDLGKVVWFWQVPIQICACLTLYEILTSHLDMETASSGPLTEKLGVWVIIILPVDIKSIRELLFSVQT